MVWNGMKTTEHAYTVKWSLIHSLLIGKKKKTLKMKHRTKQSKIKHLEEK